ncbi:radical SAM protein [Brenneria izadpanahii]|uniref:Radical SAM protein n=1 Tax=Brenneria izadpanahii TaxID=2722756 RepID=A0ABX7UNR3_9GAMM|nr:radical SAM protein [Brenneria izadpanahii]QTF07181.1 radical SAM protein [Brenneria izadpanahii]
MLLGTSFTKLAENNVDYWMKPDATLSAKQVEEQLINLKWNEDSNLQIYIHVPFCTQKCSFCAFSGGNSLAFEEARDYANLVITQLDDIYERTGLKSKKIDTIHIGGGSPDLLNDQIGLILLYLVNLPGFHTETEIAVEFSLYSVRPEFLEALGKYPVTKASFGVQILNPTIRKYIKMPQRLRKFDEVSAQLRKTIPVVNVDLMTGFPEQSLDDVMSDLEYFINHPSINCISSYLFSQGSAPAFIADVLAGHIPTPPTEEHHANLRLHTFSTLQRHGWRRYGTNTYIDISDVPVQDLQKIKGNECLGAHAYNDFLIAVGASAVGYFPGLRVENKTNLDDWINDVKRGRLPYDLFKCSLDKQKDMALWGFPLNYHGLKKSVYEDLVREGIIDQTQQDAFRDFISQGLIRLGSDGVYNLTITGEVFQGHIVKGLKKQRDQSVISEYIQEGRKLAELAASGVITVENALNNRQQSILKKTEE